MSLLLGMLTVCLAWNGCFSVGLLGLLLCSISRRQGNGDDLGRETKEKKRKKKSHLVYAKEYRLTEANTSVETSSARGDKLNIS